MKVTQAALPAAALLLGASTGAMARLVSTSAPRYIKLGEDFNVTITNIVDEDNARDNLALIGYGAIGRPDEEVGALSFTHFNPQDYLATDKDHSRDFNITLKGIKEFPQGNLSVHVVILRTEEADNKAQLAFLHSDLTFVGVA